jgi:hypothetical protein
MVVVANREAEMLLRRRDLGREGRGDEPETEQDNGKQSHDGKQKGILHEAGNPAGRVHALLDSPDVRRMTN